MPSIFNFVEKEGKFFAPIVQDVPAGYRLATDADTGTRYTGSDGQEYVANGMTTEKSGVKGVFAKFRFTSNNTDEAELFAVNTQYFNSSN